MRSPAVNINIQGHRGARGLFPENTLAAFIGAVDMGVRTLEMDLVVSKDLQVVVSHEAWMNPDFCVAPGGVALDAGAKQLYNLYRMDYEQIRQFDCGIKAQPLFPDQQLSSQYKPLLSEVFKRIGEHVIMNELPPVFYNLEIKTEQPDGTFNPDAPLFVELVYRLISMHSISHLVTLQSFDTRILREIKLIDPALKTGLLIENDISFEENVHQLGFVPDAYNPDYRLVSEALIAKIRTMNILINPWTVNEPADMKKLIGLGVDGIITDYPDRLIALLKEDGATYV